MYNSPCSLIYKPKGEDQLVARKEILSLNHHGNEKGISTGAAIAVIVQMNVDRVAEFTTEFFGFFLGKCASCDD